MNKGFHSVKKIPLCRVTQWNFNDKRSICQSAHFLVNITYLLRNVLLHNKCCVLEYSDINETLLNIDSHWSPIAFSFIWPFILSEALFLKEPFINIIFVGVLFNHYFSSVYLFYFLEDSPWRSRKRFGLHHRSKRIPHHYYIQSHPHTPLQGITPLISPPAIG